MIDKDTINTILNILRRQRDDKAVQHLSGSWSIDPKIFANGAHYVVGPIEFKSPYTVTPKITYGVNAQQSTQDITTLKKATGYTPLVLFTYTWGFDQHSGLISGFYIGMYALTSPPSTSIRYNIDWTAVGRGTPYSQQRTDEAWTHAYNKNHSEHLVNETNQADNQG